MTDNETNTSTPEITITRRATIDVPATIDGLLDAIAKLMPVVPNNAEIVQIAQYQGCPDEILEAEEAGVPHEDLPDHDPITFLSLTFEFEEEES